MAVTNVDFQAGILCGKLAYLPVKGVSPGINCAVDKPHLPFAAAAVTVFDELFKHADHWRQTHAGAEQYYRARAGSIQNKFAAGRHGTNSAADFHVLGEII